MYLPHLSAMDWNNQNQLSHITRGTTEAYYQYSNGQRIRKYVDKVSEKEERIYLGNYEVYRKYDSSNTLIVERETIHVSDDTGRIAMLEIRTQGNASDDNYTAATLTRYIYSNHLQSASLELDGSAAIISYEEYHPYGTTAYQASYASINAVAKRYRYTGKERDEESGLYYHGARYYIPWLCRWCAVDPLESKYAGWSSYNYGFDNPVKWMDSTGMNPDDPQNVQNPDAPGAPSNPKVVEEFTVTAKRPGNTVDNTGHTPFVVPRMIPDFMGTPSGKLDINSSEYFYPSVFGWQNSGISAGSPYTPDALSEAGLFTVGEARNYDNAVNAQYQNAVRMTEINAYSKEANEAMRMQNPIYLGLKGAYELTPLKTGANVIKDFSEKDYSGVAINLALSAPIIGSLLRPEANAAKNAIENAANGWIKKDLYKELRESNPKLLEAAEELLNKGYAKGAEGAEGIKWLKGGGINGYRYELKFKGQYGNFRLLGNMQTWTNQKGKEESIIIFEQLYKK